MLYRPSRLSGEERRVHDRAVEGIGLADESLVGHAVLNAEAHSEAHAGGFLTRRRRETSHEFQHTSGGRTALHDE